MPECPVPLLAAWPRLISALSRRRGILFLDFDGTLVPFSQRPDAPHLTGEQQALLRRLGRTAGWTVAIVSGRALQDVRRRVGVQSLIYVGNHGLEIEGRGLAFRHPGAVAARADLAALRRNTALAEEGFRGVRIEDKGLSWTLHVRTVAPADRPQVLRAFWAVVGSAARRGRVRIQAGAMIREALPPVAWHKGRAVRWILARISRQSSSPVIYVGDEQGDEPAFAALGPAGISVVVGRRQRTRARFCLRNPREVNRFLDRLNQVLDGVALGAPPTPRSSRSQE